MNDRKLKEVKEWLEFIQQPLSPGMLDSSLQTHKETMAPARALAVGHYQNQARKAQTKGTEPKSIYEGLQTIVNLCRVKAEYDPIDVENKGNYQHFLAFTNYLAHAPFLTLIQAKHTKVDQKSKNTDELIDSFVETFIGLTKENYAQVKESVTKLVSNIASYAQKKDKQANFFQNLLMVNNSGDLLVTLHYTLLEIKEDDGKFTITYESNYKLYQAQYQLSASMWDTIQPHFSTLEKTTTDKWIDFMKTPPKKDSKVKTPCFDD